MQIVNKFLSATLAVALLATMSAGCSKQSSSSAANASSQSSTSAGSESSASSSGSAGTAKKLLWLTQSPGPDPSSWEVLLKPILEEYNKANHVNVVGEYYGFNDMFQVVQVKIASGNSNYDILSVDGPMVASYAYHGYISSMDQYFTDAEKNEIAPASLKASSYNGKLYAPPMNTSSQVLYYNKDLLAKANVSVPDSDVNHRLTWDQVVDMAKKAISVVDPKGNNGISGIAFEQINRTYQMCALPNSMGEKSISDDGLSVNGVINDDGWVNALTWYQNIFKQGLCRKGLTADSTSNIFKSGKIVFEVGGTWDNVGFAKAKVNFGYAPCPTFKGYEGKVATPTDSWHFGIVKSSKNADEAAKFIKYMSIGNGNTEWLKANGDVPSTKAALDAIAKDSNSSGVLKIAAYEAGHTAVPRALTPGYTEYSTIMDQTWSDVMNGADPKTSLNKATSQIDAALAKYKQ